MPVYDAVAWGFKSIFFVAVLLCSCYAYAELCLDMKRENRLMFHTHAYLCFVGVTRLLIPDNHKTGVIFNTKYETVLNRSYKELAEYYNTAISKYIADGRHIILRGAFWNCETYIACALGNAACRKFKSVRYIRTPELFVNMSLAFNPFFSEDRKVSLLKTAYAIWLNCEFTKNIYSGIIQLLLDLRDDKATHKCAPSIRYWF